MEDWRWGRGMVSARKKGVETMGGMTEVAVACGESIGEWDDDAHASARMFQRELRLYLRALLLEKTGKRYTIGSDPDWGYRPFFVEQG